MKVLVVGANGNTGKHLVNQLLEMKCEVKVLVRPNGLLPDSWQNNPQVTIIRKAIAEVSIDEMSGYINDCDAVASCLGHNMSFKGIYGHPRKLVTSAVKLICNAIEKNSPSSTVKFVLMNTSGNRNRDLSEPVSLKHRMLLSLIRLLLPPHTDNENAADYLRLKIGGKHPLIQWAAVRPDSLIDKEEVSDYEVFESPVRDAIFNPGKTSRINVGHFMASLIADEKIWNKWKSKMPVVYNKEEVL